MRGIMTHTRKKSGCTLSKKPRFIKIMRAWKVVDISLVGLIVSARRGPQQRNICLTIVSTNMISSYD